MSLFSKNQFLVNKTNHCNHASVNLNNEYNVSQGLTHTCSPTKQLARSKLNHEILKQAMKQMLLLLALVPSSQSQVGCCRQMMISRMEAG
jgi:hypothetical protein